MKRGSNETGKPDPKLGAQIRRADQEHAQAVPNDRAAWKQEGLRKHQALVGNVLGSGLGNAFTSTDGPDLRYSKVLRKFNDRGE